MSYVILSYHFVLYNYGIFSLMQSTQFSVKVMMAGFIGMAAGSFTNLMSVKI